MALSDATRAEITALLRLGESLGEVSRKCHVAKSTVAAIRDSLGKSRLTENRTTDEKEIGRNPDEIGRLTIDEMVAESLYDRLKLQKAITRVVSDENYLKRQTAADLSRLLEVSDAYSLRLLEAASEAGGEDGEEEDPAA